MCDQAKIERELSDIVREIGGIRNCGDWAQIIARNMQQAGATRLADLTVAQLLQAIADAEQVMDGLYGHEETLEMQRAH